MSIQEQDPLAGDVERWVDPELTRSDDEIERGEEMEARFHRSGGDGTDEYWADFDELHPDYKEDEVTDYNPERPVTNMFVLNLEKEIKNRAHEQGLSEEEAARVYSATFLLKDGKGNPSDTLKVDISHYKGPISRPGASSFYLAPVNGEKDQWGRDAKNVFGVFHLGGMYPKDPADSSFSMSYEGGHPDTMRQYAKDAMQADRLAAADLLELKTPNNNG